jgi:hypothetical protein
MSINKIKEKLHMPKAQSFHEGSSLEAIVRDSLYFAWPGASFEGDKERRRHLPRQADAIEEEDAEEEG